VTDPVRVVEWAAVRAPGKSNQKEASMAGMLKKLIASGVAAKVVQEARKPANQAKIKKMIADFQAKQGKGGRRPGGSGH
jgi:hypothetical protein